MIQSYKEVWTIKYPTAAVWGQRKTFLPNKFRNDYFILYYTILFYSVRLDKMQSFTSFGPHLWSLHVCCYSITIKKSVS